MYTLCIDINIVNYKFVRVLYIIYLSIMIIMSIDNLSCIMIDYWAWYIDYEMSKQFCFCNILLLGVSDSYSQLTSKCMNNIHASITALFKIYQQKVHWSSSVRHADVYLQGIVPLFVSNLIWKPTFPFFLLSRKENK